MQPLPPPAPTSQTPYVLIARVKVKEGKVDDYLQLAAAADNGVMTAEPGMLHHTFDISPDDPQCFTWSEAYLNDAALGAHLTNPAIGVYLEAHAPLCESFEVEVYGTLGE